MKESEFIRRNQKDWERLERLLVSPHKDADRLHDLFVKVSTDLNFARSYYPKRSVRLYLNGLTMRVFGLIQSRKDRFGLSDIKEFFTKTLPYQIYESRHSFYLSLVTFALAVAIGVFSGMQDSDFLGVVVGDEYVAMTEENINNLDPMAVYKQSPETDMFVHITTNNIKVAFFAFVMGFLGIFGTLVVLLYNGIMLGAFQYFFYSKGLFWTSFLTIWIHGTIEISVIIVAGAAGVILGKGVVFTKTYDWSTSVQMAALKGLRIVISTVPLFVIAGFLEGFVTRHTEWHWLIKVSIILSSLLLILTIYVFIPRRVARMGSLDDEKYQINPGVQTSLRDTDMRLRFFGGVLSLGFTHLRMYLSDFVNVIVVAFAAFMTMWYMLPRGEDLYQHLGIVPLFLVYFTTLCIVNFTIVCFGVIANGNQLAFDSVMKSVKETGLGAVLYISILSLLLILVPSIYWLVVALLWPPQILAILHFEGTQEGPIARLKSSFSHYFNSYVNYIGYNLLFGLGLAIVAIAFSVGALRMIRDVISWHTIDGQLSEASTVADFLILFLVLMISVPILYGFYKGVYDNQRCIRENVDLERQIESFGQHSDTFEGR